MKSSANNNESGYIFIDAPPYTGIYQENVSDYTYNTFMQIELNL